jgi:uncharacterized membrane protein YbhN (UPF0104 family)
MKTSRRVIQWAGLIALVALGAWYVTGHAGELRQIRAFQPAYLAPLIGVHLAALALNGWMNRKLVAELGPRLRIVEWYGLAAVNALANYLPLPQAGAAVRGAYLKRLHGLSYRHYAATVLFTYVLTFVLIGLVGLLGLAHVQASGGRISPWLWVVFVGMASLALLLVPGVTRLVPSGRWLGAFIEGYRTLGSAGTIGQIVFWKLTLIAVNATGLWLAYRSIGRPAPWAGTLLVSLTATASGVANVTPGNAGTAEAAAWVCARWVGSDADLAVTVYLVYRLTAALVIFSLGPLFVIVLNSRLSSREMVHAAPAKESQFQATPDEPASEA